MKLIEDLRDYKKRCLCDSYHNLNVLTGIEISRLKEIIEKSSPINEKEEYLIERLVH